MIIYEDTRNKANKHQNKHDYFKKNNIKVIRKKLDYGDYMLENNPNVSVDTKQDLMELAQDMYSDKTRFEKELRNAYINGVKLYILVEQRVPDKQTLLRWKAKKDIAGKRITQIDGIYIYQKMKEHSLFYKTKYRFCRKVDSGKKIIEILTKS